MFTSSKYDILNTKYDILTTPKRHFGSSKAALYASESGTLTFMKFRVACFMQEIYGNQRLRNSISRFLFVIKFYRYDNICIALMRIMLKCTQCTEFS